VVNYPSLPLLISTTNIVRRFKAVNFITKKDEIYLGKTISYLSKSKTIVLAEQ